MTTLCFIPIKSSLQQHLRFKSSNLQPSPYRLWVCCECGNMWLVCGIKWFQPCTSNNYIWRTMFDDGIFGGGRCTLPMSWSSSIGGLPIDGKCLRTVANVWDRGTKSFLHCMFDEPSSHFLIWNISFFKWLLNNIELWVHYLMARAWEVFGSDEWVGFFFHPFDFHPLWVIPCHWEMHYGLWIAWACPISISITSQGTC